MPSVAIVSLAIFSASAVLPFLHSLAISSTFVRALLLASSARVPTSTLILATHLSHSLIGCCAIAGVESQASEARAVTAVIIRVIRFTSPCVRRAHSFAVGRTTALPSVVTSDDGGSAPLRRTEGASFYRERAGAGQALGAELRRRDGDRRRRGTDRERLRGRRRRDVDVLDVMRRVVSNLEHQHRDQRHHEGRCSAAPSELPDGRGTSEAGARRHPFRSFIPPAPIRPTSSATYGRPRPPKTSSATPPTSASTPTTGDSGMVSFFSFVAVIGPISSTFSRVV